MLKKAAAVLLCVIIPLSLSSCGASNKQAAVRGKDKIKVSVTFNAIKEFAEAVGQDKAEVSAIIPDGMKAHGFEPKARDLSDLRDAKIFVYNGLGMEEWAEEAIKSANNERLIVVNASEGAELLEEAGHDGPEEGSHGGYDPHLWLGIRGAQAEARNIKEAFVKADPANKDYYEKNCSDFIAELESIYNDFDKKFRAVPKKDFVTGHAAFGYLCHDFGLVQNSVTDIYAEGEPGARQLARLVEYCRENNVTTIFAEKTASSAVSRTLAREVGARVETIYTMESSEDNKSYLDRMKENLDKIYNSLTE